MNWKWSSRRTALIASVLASLAVVAVVAGQSLASAGSHHSAKASSSVIIDGTTDTVVNIDPANEYDYGSFTVDLLIFQGLYGFPNGAKLQPVLATGCKASTNLKTWTCGLRQGVKFSDGNTMTSADVKYSFDRVLKIKGDQGIYTLLSNLASTTTSGPNTVVFHLKAPQSTWPLILSTNAGYIVEKSKYPANKILANTDPQYGTGPYQLTKFSPGQQAVFTPNPNYWGPKPKNGGLIINYYSKSSTMKLALQKGEIDMVFRDFTPTELQSLAKTKGIVVHAGNGVVIRYLVFNVKTAPFNNIAVRKAIAYLMPRQTIASRVYHGSVQPLYSMVPKGLPGAGDPYKTLYGAAPSKARAAAALKAAGVTTPVPVTLWWTPSHYGDASADEYTEIQRALNASGLFKVTLKSAEWAQYSGSLGKTYGAFQLGWFPDYPDAEDYTVSFYQCGAFYNNNYCNPAMTKLIAKERGARTTAVRLATLRAMQLLAAKDLPTIPYWQGKMIAVSHSNIQGVNSTLDAAFYMRFWKLSKS
jgi:peptide/nickel transport system substrate-binding protein